MSRNTAKQFNHDSKKIEDYEERVLILDIIDKENNTRTHKHNYTIIQTIGKKHFTLLELSLKNERTSTPLLSEINLENETNDTVTAIKKTIAHEKLTKVAQFQLGEAVEKIISENSAKFINFFNQAPSLSLRLHSLQLIKRIGPKARNSIIQARKEKLFNSFDDFTERTGINDIQGLLKNRVMLEIIESQHKHRLFTRPHYTSY